MGAEVAEDARPIRRRLGDLRALGLGLGLGFAR